jgi:hypothetical protein
MKTHSHPSALHVMTCYRRFILGFKRRHGKARGIVVYRGLIDEYLRCKADVINQRMKPITIWLRLNSQSGEYDHNHIEDGFIPSDQSHPTTVNSEQKRMWVNGSWRAQYAYLNNKYQVIECKL